VMMEIRFLFFLNNLGNVFRYVANKYIEK